MNITLKGMLAAGILSGASFAYAVDSTITVTGTVLQRTCTIDKKDVTVDLGNLYTSDLVNVNSTSSWKNFQLKLTNCQNMSTVTAMFSGTSDSNDYYKNNGDASNVMVEIQEVNGNTALKSGSKISANVSNNNATLDLRARAVSKGNTGAGSINSQITVTYTYA